MHSTQTAVLLKPAMGSGHTRPPFSTVDSNVAVQATQTHREAFFQSTHSSVLDMQHTHTKASQCKTQTGQASVILGLIMCFSSLCSCFWWDKSSSAATLDVWCLNTYSGSFTALNHYRSAPPEFVPSHQRTYTADNTLNTRIIELNSPGILSWRCQALVFFLLFDYLWDRIGDREV